MRRRIKVVQTNGLATRIKAEPLAGMVGYGGEKWLSLQLSTQHTGYTNRAHISVSALRPPSGSMREPTKSSAATAPVPPSEATDKGLTARSQDCRG